MFGIICGAIFAYFSIVRLKWSIRSYIFMVLVLATFYIAALYFMRDPVTEALMLYLPMFAFGMTEVMTESVATYSLAQYIPFPHFSQNITIVGFARCGIGTAAMDAIVERMPWIPGTYRHTLHAAGTHLPLPQSAPPAAAPHGRRHAHLPPQTETNQKSTVKILSSAQNMLNLHS